MELYVNQLIEDIKSAMDNVPRPYIPAEGMDFWDIPTPEEEERTARVCQLGELTHTINLNTSSPQHLNTFNPPYYPHIAGQVPITYCHPAHDHINTSHIEHPLIADQPNLPVPSTSTPQHLNTSNPP